MLRSIPSAKFFIVSLVKNTGSAIYAVFIGKNVKGVSGSDGS